MTARLIDGVALAKAIRDEVTLEAAKLAAQGMKPGLAVVLIGEDPASKAYVGSKEKACIEAGMHSVKVTRPATAPESEVLDIVRDIE